MLASIISDQLYIYTSMLASVKSAAEDSNRTIRGLEIHGEIEKIKTNTNEQTKITKYNFNSEIRSENALYYLYARVDDRIDAIHERLDRIEEILEQLERILE